MNNLEGEKILRNKVTSLGVIFENPTPDFFQSLFTQDCDYITFNGQYLKGIEENLKIHQDLAGHWMFKKAELQAKILQIKFLSNTVATVISSGGIKFRWQKELPKNRQSINTMIFIKEGEDWKLSSFQNTRVKPLGFLQKIFFK